MTAWKATAMPSQPVQACGIARARFVESIESAPVTAACTPARWICEPSAVGDAVTTWFGPPAAAGATRHTVKVAARTRTRRIPRRFPAVEDGKRHRHRDEK